MDTTLNLSLYWYIMDIIHTYIQRALRFVKRKLNPPISNEKARKRKMLEDYEYLRSCGVDTELGYVTLYGKPIIMKAPNSTIKIGKDVLLISDSVYNSAGVNHPVILSTEKEGAEIILGDGTGFSGTSIVAFSSIRIGNRSGCGVNCNIWDSDFHSVDSNERGKHAKPQDAPTQPITIGEDVWIGANVTILKGVTIGDRTVVGSMSLVNKDIEADTLVVGIPANVIKKLK